MIAWLEWLWQRLRPRDRSLRALPTPQQFRWLLECERARTDRSGNEFSLLVFSSTDRRCQHAVFSELFQAMRARLRITDQPGWLDQRHLAVILPLTPGWGAWKVADDLCLRLSASPVSRVYVYPNYWPARAQGSGAGTQPVGLPTGAGHLREDMSPLFVMPQTVWRRALDFIVAAAAGFAALPLLLCIGVAIKLSSPGPALFVQKRRGQGGRPFDMIKFRTMTCDAPARQDELRDHNEADGPVFKMRDDPRVFRFGEWLRRTSLDELPQLWNVLKGDMSIVGPRPLPGDEANACESWRRHRLDVKPGLTCRWQINKHRGIKFDDWMRLDITYIRQQSIWEDLRIALQTIPSVLLGRNH